MHHRQNLCLLLSHRLRNRKLCGSLAEQNTDLLCALFSKHGMQCGDGSQIPGEDVAWWEPRRSPRKTSEKRRGWVACWRASACLFTVVTAAAHGDPGAQGLPLCWALCGGMSVHTMFCTACTMNSINVTNWKLTAPFGPVRQLHTTWIV